MTPTKTRILLIDNYDSFTFNLVHYLQELGAAVEVVRNDALSVEEVLAHPAQGILISPGPCDPDTAGICLPLLHRIIQHSSPRPKPLLGVCLGHQSIGQACGGQVVRAPQPMHGKTSQISHHGKGVFAGLPSPYTATRYHSLIVARETLPDCLEITAEADGLIMGLQHKILPLHGVQFHPESIASEHGHALLKNFLNMCQ